MIEYITVPIPKEWETKYTVEVSPKEFMSWITTIPGYEFVCMVPDNSGGVFKKL